jgi:hypothetical protein
MTSAMMCTALLTVSCSKTVMACPLLFSSHEAETVAVLVAGAAMRQTSSSSRQMTPSVTACMVQPTSHLQTSWARGVSVLRTVLTMPLTASWSLSALVMHWTPTARVTAATMRTTLLQLRLYPVVALATTAAR